MSKKRTYDFISNPTLTNAKKKIGKCVGAKKNKNCDNEDGDDGDDGYDGDDQSNPLVLPNLFKKEDDHLIYLKHNHLYFHTEVSEDSVDVIKKLMRQYWSKMSNIKKTHECVVFKPKPLYLHIFSPGGCVYSGLSLYDFVIEYKKKFLFILLLKVW